MSKTFSQSTRFARSLGAGLALMLAMSLAVPSLGRADIPELPNPDGSSDTPEMIIKMIDRTETKLSSLRGKVTLLNFFLSTCSHCQEQAPHMAQLYNKYSKQGLVILGLAHDSLYAGGTDPYEKSASVKDFIKEYKIPYPVGFTTVEVIAYYGDSHNHGVPQMVLFGADGKMARRITGWDANTEKDLTEAIEAQLQKAQTVKPGSKATGWVNPRRKIYA
jgi:peroxiredoxin